MCLTLFGSIALTSPARAQLAGTADSDRGTRGTAKGADGEQPEQLPWRGTALLWWHGVSTQTVGVGDDYQSRNPSYSWVALLAPNYYLLDEPDWSLAAQLEIGVGYEFTNSDLDTQRGQVDTVAGTASDAIVALSYNRTLYQHDAYTTGIQLIFPEFLLPTSRASRNTGVYSGFGIGVLPRQSLPLAGPDSAVFQSLRLRGIARYRYYLRESEVPANAALDARPRTDVDGVPITSAQLEGAAFPEHETRFGFDVGVQISKRVSFSTRFEWRPIWTYEFSDDVEVCTVLTGCAVPDGVDDPQTFRVVTLFSPQLNVAVMDELSVGAGYSNLTTQMGPDGQRRNMLWSPDALFNLTFVLNLDVIYQKHLAAPPPAEPGGEVAGLPSVGF